MDRSRRDALKAAGRLIAAPLYAAAGARAASPPLHSPYLQNVGPGQATVMWATPDRGDGLLEVSTDRDFRDPRTFPARIREFRPAETALPATFFQFQADAAGLAPGTDYYYRAFVDGIPVTPDASPDDCRFRTAGPGPFTCVVIGDSGEPNQAAVDLAKLILTKERPALLIHTGDIAYPLATFNEFNKYYFDYYRDLMAKFPFYPVLGNHEYFTDRANPAINMHAVPTATVPLADRGRYYSFDWGDVHFVVLDSNDPLAAAIRGTGRMLEWLDADLEATRRFWRVVCFHHPAFPNDKQQNDPITAQVRERINPILEKYDVQLVLSGHEHNYQRTRPVRNGLYLPTDEGTVHVTTGGGGAALYFMTPRPWLAATDYKFHYVRLTVRGARMTVTEVRVDGTEGDSFTLAPHPLLSAESSVVNAASFTTAVAPGGLISIFGRFLAVTDGQAASTPLPTMLAGTEVTFEGTRLPLLFVSRSQINAQLPFGAVGRGVLRVSNPNGGSQSTIVISETAPAILTLGLETGRYPAVLHQDGTLCTEVSPAHPGEALSVYLTGLGAVNGEITAGQTASTSTLHSARAPVEVQIGALRFPPLFAGLAPGFVGLNQVNLVAPDTLSPGAYSLRILARGNSSNPVVINVQR